MLLFSAIISLVCLNKLVLKNIGAGHQRIYEKHQKKQAAQQSSRETTQTRGNEKSPMGSQFEESKLRGTQRRLSFLLRYKAVRPQNGRLCTASIKLY